MYTGDFVLDLQAVRDRARENMEEGAVTENYGGDAEKAVGILNEALATEILCMLRYRFHAVTAQGIDSEAVRHEFAEHAREESEHADMIADRINQLGGKPNFNPDGLSERAASQYVEGQNLIDMIRENLIAERIAVDTYRAMVRYFAQNDPTTRRMLEKVLAKEEEHADEMHDLLVGHEGHPMLSH